MTSETSAGNVRAEIIHKPTTHQLTATVRASSTLRQAPIKETANGRR
jgi:hypothetical protein